MDRLRRLAEKASSVNKKTALSTIVILLAIASFFLFFRALFFIVALVLLNLFAGLLMRRARLVLRNVGIEFVTFSTILAGFAFGPFVGAIVGATARMSEAFAMGRAYSLPITAPAYALLGIIAGIMAPANVLNAGVMLAVIYSIIAAAATQIALRTSPHVLIIFTVTQIAFTIFLINTFFPLLFMLTRI